MLMNSHFKHKNIILSYAQNRFQASYLGLREPAQPIPGKQPKIVEAKDAFNGLLKSNSSAFASAAAATPTLLLNAMTDYAKSSKLSNIKLYHMHLEGKVPWADKSCEGIFRSVSFFMGKNVRQAVAEGRADAIPVFLSEIPLIMFKKVIEPDLAILNVSPPDKHGYCTFGTSIDCVRSGVMCSKKIVAQINENMPRTFGDSLIHISQIDVGVKCSEPLPLAPPGNIDETSKKIGKLIADMLIEDGSTLQMGIGNIPNAALAALTNHKDLAIHSEMFSDGVIDLYEKGCITNKFKKRHCGKTIVSFVVGSQKLYDFVHNNPFIEFLKVEYVNHTKTISKQPKMVAINSCIEVDLTGQVVSDSIGPKLFSGFGGQVDFIRGTGESEDGKGKPIIAFISTNKGKSKIVPFIKQGAGVITTRAHVQYVVTEHGIANLFGKSIRQRAYELIKIADPSAREMLEKAAFDRLKVKPGP